MLYAIFHNAYVSDLHERVDRGPLPDLTSAQAERLRADIIAAEQTGLRPSQFDPAVLDYLRPARDASVHGYSVAFIAVALIGAVGAAACAWLVRRPREDGVASRPP